MPLNVLDEMDREDEEGCACCIMVILTAVLGAILGTAGFAVAVLVFSL